MSRRALRRAYSLPAALLLCALLLLLPSYQPPAAASPAPASLAACKELNTPKDLLKGHASDIAIVEQGYHCILSHYITGKSLDDRVLLRGAFNEIAVSLPSSLSGFTMPPMLGDRTIDWDLFAEEYDTIASLLSQSAGVQQAMAELALIGMTMGLHDDHLSYWTQDETKEYVSQISPNTPVPTLGIITSPITATVKAIFITDVLPGTPAAGADLRPGDTIELVDGKPAVSAGQQTAALNVVSTPQVGVPVSLTLLRPSTGARFTVSLQPRSMVMPFVTAHLLSTGIAYVRVVEFSANAASRVLAAIQGLKLVKGLRGVVLDLRGNPGGTEDQAVKILGDFVPKAVVGYEVHGNATRDALRTGSTATLQHVPLEVLTDGDSASSSELVASAVRDLDLGHVVGSRTAGEIAGAYFYSLSDASSLEITAFHVLGAKGEKIDNIGVAPDQQATATAAALSAGDDPVIDRAVRDILQG
jgi:carboxyl-terminal processing protease